MRGLQPPSYKNQRRVAAVLYFLGSRLPVLYNDQTRNKHS